MGNVLLRRSAGATGLLACWCLVCVGNGGRYCIVLWGGGGVVFGVAKVYLNAKLGALQCVDARRVVVVRTEQATTLSQWTVQIVSKTNALC